MATDAAALTRYRANLQGEVDGTAIYRAMADGARDARLRELYLRLASTEERHASHWAALLEQAGSRADLQPTWRARILAGLARRFGPGLVVSTVAGAERRNQGGYDNQPEAAGTGMPADERSHARVLSELTSTGMEGGLLARFEGRHRAVGGNALRAAVLGANDGLVSNFSLVMAVAGAGADTGSVVIAGLAGTLAGALSMALGEWLSVQSARELVSRQIAVESAELEQFPEEEMEELRLIYEAKGIPADEARTLANRLIGDRAAALDTLVREELGADPTELGGSAWVAAGTSFALFAVGALVPVVPFLLGGGVVAAAVCAGLALFVIGAGITVVTGRNALASGLRQVAFGLAAAAISFGVGRLVGVAVG